MPTIDYATEPSLGVEEFIDVLHRSTLAARRPVDDVETLQAMLANADIILTARSQGRLIGVARSLSDFAY